MRHYIRIKQKTLWFRKSHLVYEVCYDQEVYDISDGYGLCHRNLIPQVVAKFRTEQEAVAVVDLLNKYAKEKQNEHS